MTPFLRPTNIIDHDAPAVRAQALHLAAGATDPLIVAERCFTWVRDAVAHSSDAERGPLTCRASDVLREGVGFCYAKSHLLVALLRANGIPAGLAYQRLLCDTSLALHGLVAVTLPGFGWYRIDARGNKPGVDARFCPPVERLAFPLEHSGEVDLPGIFADPLPVVVAALTSGRDWREVLADLPDTGG